ncbi:MAG TPA: hypothetical protein VHB01_10525 [Nitrosospira sp.]|nr:hypothetical protein [Nitrosospira sp.]
MKVLFDATMYPTEILEMIWEQDSLGIEIANRWVTQWPERVLNLLVVGKYQEAFLNQLQQERVTLARIGQPDQTTWEQVASRLGLSLDPPEMKLILQPPEPQPN